MNFVSIATAALILVGFISHALAAGGGTSANSVQLSINFITPVSAHEIVPPDSYSTSQSLPPHIWPSFTLKCDEAFLRLIREDLVEAETGKISILVGALISKLASGSCSTPPSSTTIDAGPTYSGRAFQVEPMRGR